MSGLLTDTIKAKLRSGVYKVEHTYFLKVPEDAAKTSYQSKTIHDLTSGDIVTVIDHGVMNRSGFNFSVSTPGKLSFGEYRFQVSNLNGFFNRGADIWEHGTTHYVAEPHECLLSRYSSIFITSWVLINGTFYTGQVDRVEYVNATMTDPKSATFFCTPLNMELLLSKTWGQDDYDELDLSSMGYFVGPLPEDN
jgi:hypothetical protein